MYVETGMGPEARMLSSRISLRLFVFLSAELTGVEREEDDDDEEELDF